MPRFRQAVEGRPEYPVMSGYRMACCDCGLVHTMNFRIIRRVNPSPDGSYQVEAVGDETLGIEITAKRNNRSTSLMRRKRMLKAYDHLYEYPNPTAKKCHYCGDKSTSVDHVPALDLVDRFGADHFQGAQFIKVQSCGHCNGLLSNLNKPMLDRFEFLYLKLAEIFNRMGTPKTEPQRYKKEKVLRRMKAIQAAAYQEHLAEREREHAAAIDRMRLGIVPYVSVISAEPNHPPSNDAGLNPSVLQQPMN